MRTRFFNLNTKKKPEMGGFYKTKDGLLMIHPTTTENTVFYHGYDPMGTVIFTGTCKGEDIGSVCGFIDKTHGCGVGECIAPWKTPRYREVQRAIGKPDRMAEILAIPMAETPVTIPAKPKSRKKAVVVTSEPVPVSDPPVVVVPAKPKPRRKKAVVVVPAEPVSEPPKKPEKPRGRPRKVIVSAMPSTCHVEPIGINDDYWSWKDDAMPRAKGLIRIIKTDEPCLMAQCFIVRDDVIEGRTADENICSADFPLDTPLSNIACWLQKQSYDYLTRNKLAPFLPEPPKKPTGKKKYRIDPHGMGFKTSDRFTQTSPTSWVYHNPKYPNYSATITWSEDDGFHIKYSTGAGWRDGRDLDGVSLSHLTIQIDRDLDYWARQDETAHIKSGKDIKQICDYADNIGCDRMPVNTKSIGMVSPDHTCLVTLDSRTSMSPFGLAVEGKPLTVDVKELSSKVDPNKVYELRKVCRGDDCQLVIESRADRKNQSIPLRGGYEAPFSDSRLSMFKFDASSTIVPDDLLYAVNQASNLSDDVVIENNGKDLYIHSINDDARMHVDVGDSISGKSVAKYGLKYLKGAAKDARDAVKDGKTRYVHFKGSDDYPMQIFYPRDRYEVTHYIAPIVGEDRR